MRANGLPHVDDFTLLSSCMEAHQAAVNMIENILGALLAAAAYDWILVTASAAKCTSFDYRYLPLSRLRIATILLLAVAIFFVIASYHPDDPPLYPCIAFIVAAVIHAIFAVLDILAQRRTGYRIPPGYGERE